MMRIWIAMMLALLLLAGCGGEKDAGYVARKLILCCRSRRQSPPGTATGLPRDGLLHMELTFSQEDALAVEEAVSSAGWSLFPWSRNWRSASTRTAGASDWPDWPVPARGGGIWRTVRERDGGYVAAVLLQLYLCGL